MKFPDDIKRQARTNDDREKLMGPFISPTGIATYNISEMTAMIHGRGRPMLTALPCSRITGPVALNYIRNHLALVSYSSVGRQDLVFTSVGNGISSKCQLQSLIRCRFASPVTRRLPEAHPQALGEAVPHLLPLTLELLPQGMNLPLLGFRG